MGHGGPLRSGPDASPPPPISHFLSPAFSPSLLPLNRYLTFCSYTLQMVQLALCCLAHVAVRPAHRCRLAAAADRLSCALFGIANTVTALFFAIEKSTNVSGAESAAVAAGSSGSRQQRVCDGVQLRPIEPSSAAAAPRCRLAGPGGGRRAGAARVAQRGGAHLKQRRRLA